MAQAIWILGNWKQNLLRAPAAHCAESIAAGLGDLGGHIRVGVAPTYTALDAVAPHTRGDLMLLAQDIAAQQSGAFTGEVGAEMLAEAGVEGAIVGHSERRAMFGDHDALVASKLESAHGAGLVVVLCVGERLEARDSGEHENVVISQLSAGLANLRDEQCDARLVIAYEPVWAIGTGRTATPDQASAMHRRIRAWMGERFGGAGADRSVLYGGSVKPGNAAQLLAAGDIDGFLVGGASLDPESFLGIVSAAKSS